MIKTNLATMRKMRDEIDSRFIRELDAIILSNESVGDHRYQRVANQAMIGARLDKMIREEIEVGRQRRSLLSREADT